MKDENFLRSKGVDVDKSLELFGDMETYNLTLNDFLGAISEKIENLDLWGESYESSLENC